MVMMDDGHVYTEIAGLRNDTGRYDTGPNAGEAGPRWRARTAADRRLHDAASARPLASSSRERTGMASKSRNRRLGCQR
jgi:hypothetical protein